MTSNVTKTRAADLAVKLGRLEAQWEGHVVGIGFDIDDETGKMTLVFSPEDRPDLGVKIETNITSVFVGDGPTN